MKIKIPAVEKLTIGLDLRDRRHHACVLDERSEILAEEVIVNTREVLTAFRRGGQNRPRAPERSLGLTDQP